MPHDDDASAPITSGDHVVVDVRRLVAGGKGLGHLPDGRVVLVDGGLPGDRADVRLTRIRKNMAEGEVHEVVVAAAGRVSPPCPEVERGCGGCDLQHARMSLQSDLKVGIVVDALRRIAKIDDLPVVAGVALDPFGHRTTLRCVVDPQTGRLGFRRRHSQMPHVVDDCMIAHPLAAEIIRGSLFPDAREVTVRVAPSTGERMVVVTGDADGCVVPTDVRVVRATAVAGTRRVRIDGGAVGDDGADDRSAIHEVVAGRRFRISAGSFFQARPDGAVALIDAVGRALGDLDPVNDRLVDLYGGVGLFTAGLGARNGELVEMSRSATADARINLADLGTTVRTMDVARWRPSAADVVVADPARAGLGRDGIAAVVGTRARSVALVSCDPAAMARDVRMLTDAGYRPIGAELVDMFPQTHHVEVVTGLHR